MERQAGANHYAMPIHTKHFAEKKKKVADFPLQALNWQTEIILNWNLEANVR